MASAPFITEGYLAQCNKPSTINEHLPCLERLVRECRTIAEFGALPFGGSTFALLQGLVFPGGAQEDGRCLWLNDVRHPSEEEARTLTQLIDAAHGVCDVQFECGSDLEVPLRRYLDMIFIDTWHVYAQLKRELDRFEPTTAKFIVIHNTTIDAHDGETSRLSWLLDAEEQSSATGFPVDEIRTGLWPAIEEFIARHAGEWTVLRRYTHNNGLTILARRQHCVGAAYELLQADLPPVVDVQFEVEPAVPPATIAIMVPCTSKNRDEWSGAADSYLIRHLVKSLVATRTIQDSVLYHLLLGIDGGDRIYDSDDMRAATAAISLEHPDVTFEYVPFDGLALDAGHVTAMWNHLFQVALNHRTFHFDYFYQCGDDVVFHKPGWVAECLRVASHHFESGVGVCGPDDASTSRILTQSFVTRAHHYVFGTFFPPEIRNWHCDDWITEVYGNSSSNRCHRLLDYKCSNKGGNPRYQGRRADDLYKSLVERDRPKITEYLERTAMLHQSPPPTTLLPPPRKVAVCIEPRRHPAMRLVLSEFAKHLHSDWHLLLVAGRDNVEWMQDIVSTTLEYRLHTSEVRVLSGCNNLTVEDYSRLLLSPQFWRQMPGEHILVFQTDSIPVGGKAVRGAQPEDYFGFDYVGAPWSWDVDGKGVRVGNGGLSLRKRSSSIAATSHPSAKEWGTANEDGFFARHFFHNKDQYRVPSVEQASRFSVETLGPALGEGKEVPWGTHKSWMYHQYANKELTVKYPTVARLQALQDLPMEPDVLGSDMVWSQGVAQSRVLRRRLPPNLVGRDFFDWAKYASRPTGARLSAAEMRKMIDAANSGSLLDGGDAEMTILWVKTSDVLGEFSTAALELRRDVLLITTDGDESMPGDIPSEVEQRILHNPHITKWYVQNYNCMLSFPSLIGSGNKLFPFPIGMNLHVVVAHPTPTEMVQDMWHRHRASKPAGERLLRAFCDCHRTQYTRFNNNRGTLSAMQRKQSSVCVDFAEARCSLLELYDTWSRYAFVLSAHGNGLDCHRTWEALLLGCIVVVQTSTLDDLYRGLPVVILNEWSELERPDLAAHMEQWRADLAPLTVPDYVWARLRPEVFLQSHEERGTLYLSKNVIVATTVTPTTTDTAPATTDTAPATTDTAPTITDTPVATDTTPASTVAPATTTAPATSVLCRKNPSSGVVVPRTADNCVHVMAPPTTVVSPEFSVCAFTHHVRTLADMLHPHGWHVIEYGNEGSTSAADEHVVVLPRRKLDALKVGKRSTDVTSLENNNRKLMAAYYGKALSELKKRCRPGDIVCHTYGPRNEIRLALPSCHHVESHVGYPTYPPHGLRFRIFATNAWMHVHYGKAESSSGNIYSWVAPLAFYVDEWTVRPQVASDAPVVFLGRVTEDKGISTLIDVARAMPEQQFVVCGPGDEIRLKAKVAGVPPNFTFKAPITGAERDAYLGEARCVVMPTDYVEPFGASGVEALLCGTPFLGTSFGGFTETIDHGVNGFRCRTRQDWIEAIRRCSALDRVEIARVARARYSLAVMGSTFNMAFRQIRDLSADGWNAGESHDPLLNGGCSSRGGLATAVHTKEQRRKLRKKRLRKQRDKAMLQEKRSIVVVASVPLTLLVSGTTHTGTIEVPATTLFDGGIGSFTLNATVKVFAATDDVFVLTRHQAECLNGIVAYDKEHPDRTFRVSLRCRTPTDLLLCISSDEPWDFALVVLVDNVISSSSSAANIPKAVYQTCRSRAAVPKRIFDTVKRLAPDYTYMCFEDDACCAFLLRYYGHAVRDRFLALEVGAHRADLFRYCILYALGGYYFDISTLLTLPLDHVFSAGNESAAWFTVVSGVADTIHQGILVSAAGNPFLRRAIHHCMTEDPTHHYSLYVETLYKMLGSSLPPNQLLQGGLNVFPAIPEWPCHLFEERVVMGDCDATKPSSSSGGAVSVDEEEEEEEEWKPSDKYGYYCTIHDGSRGVVMKTRDPTYPWNNSGGGATTTL